MGGVPSLATSELRYAVVEDVHLAYRVIHGDTSDRDVVLVLAGTMPMDALFEDPVALRVLEGLRDLGRVVVFDRRGIGLSDPPTDDEPATYARWCEDLEAVMAAAEVRRAVIVSNLLGTTAVLMYAGLHASAIEAVVLVEPAPLEPHDARYTMDQIAGRLDPAAYLFPSRFDEPGFREWFTRAGQLGASPRMAARVYPAPTKQEFTEVQQAVSAVRAPTLVLRRPGNPLSPHAASDPVVAAVPTAVRVDIPGIDLSIWGGEVDALLAEVFRFVTGAHRTLAPDRVLAAVLYTDLVGSTEQSSAVGDTRWKRVLDRHDDVARTSVGRRGGTVIKTMGDGFLAMFQSIASALDAARDVRDALGRDGLEVRAGVHVGDVERRGDDIAGVAVAIAARVESLAAPGEILVTSTAVEAAAGQPVRFEPRGNHELKGVRGTWSLFAAEW